MSYRVRWLIPNRVVYALVVDRLTAEEGQAMNDAIGEHIGIGEAPVHLVMDMRRAAFDVSKAGDTKEFFIKDKSPKLGWSIIISTNRMVNFFSAIITQNANLRARMFEKAEEALEFLMKTEPDLGDVQPALDIVNETAGMI
jgi:hypothetical protein